MDRTEVEAVARALWTIECPNAAARLTWTDLAESVRRFYEKAAEKAIAVLDAVRSPQDEDHVGDRRDEDPRESAQESQPGVDPKALAAAGEDHEAGIEAALKAANLPPWQQRRMEAAVAAYLSRCPSPERNTERDALKALVDEARADDEWVSGNDLLIRVGAIVLDRLAEFDTSKEA